MRCFVAIACDALSVAIHTCQYRSWSCGCFCRPTLAIHMGVAVMERLNVLGRNGHWVTDLAGQPDGGGDVLRHHGSLHRRHAVLTDSEDAVVLQQGRGAARS